VDTIIGGAAFVDSTTLLQPPSPSISPLSQASQIKEDDESNADAPSKKNHPLLVV